jgi:hypothetical protein
LRSKRLKPGIRIRGALHHLLLRYTQSLITQMAQTAVCNRHHSIEQRLRPWLLAQRGPSAHERGRDDSGIDREYARGRCEGITDAAGNVQEAGIIHYSRGHITILDRAKLERYVCECYAVVKHEFDRLLPDQVAS